MPAPLIHTVLTGIFLPLTTLSLGLRFYVRAQKRARIGLDDYLAVFSYLVWVINCSIVLWIVHLRAPYATDLEIPLPKLREYLLAVYVGTINAPILMTAAKFSILALYYRIFLVDRAFRIQTWIVGGLCAAWFVAALFGVVFQCTPVKAAYDYDPVIQATAKCINFSAFVVGIEVPNGVLDFAVAAIAIHVLRGLHMNFWQKLGICIIFALCTLVAVIGAIRIGITYNPEHFSPDDTTTWIIVQNAFVIICCSLPTYGSLIARWMHPFTIIRNYFIRPLSKTFSTSPKPEALHEERLKGRHGRANDPYWKMTTLSTGDADRSVVTTKVDDISRTDGSSTASITDAQRKVPVESTVQMV